MDNLVGLLNFKKNADVDGFVPDMTDQTSVSEVMYQVTIVTLPGQARYEASLTYSMKQDTFSLKVRMTEYTHTVNSKNNNIFSYQAYCSQRWVIGGWFFGSYAMGVEMQEPLDRDSWRKIVKHQSS